MLNKEKLDFAVNQVVNNCLKVKSGEKTVVITDKETKHIGLSIAELLKKVSGNVTSFIMEDFGPRPEDGSNPLKFPDVIAKAMGQADVSVYAAQGKKGEYPSFRTQMFKVFDTNKKLRHAHMIGISDAIMEMGMSANYLDIQKTSKRVFNLINKAQKINVSTARGTKLSAEFNPNWKWVICDGDISKPGHWTNLPDGEIFTCPKTVNGTAVVDGVLGDYFTEKLGLIEKTPLTLDIKNGFVTSAKCSNKDIEKEINEYIHKCENANRIGEFAIGTNLGLTKLIGNLLQDEKFPGIHIAVGHTFPEKTGADWDAEVHMDMVIQKTTIEVDGNVIMKEGKFQL